MIQESLSLKYESASASVQVLFPHTPLDSVESNAAALSSTLSLHLSTNSNPAPEIATQVLFPLISLRAELSILDCKPCT